MKKRKKPAHRASFKMNCQKCGKKKMVHWQKSDSVWACGKCRKRNRKNWRAKPI